jgi:ribonuclease BN (tRNA processing enzyme)
MNLTVLGSGTTVPHPARSSSGFWLETSGGSILLDCSASAIHRMAAERLNWAELDAIWISHFHMDHVGGLAPFLVSIKHAKETQDRLKPLWIFGPPGMRRYLDVIDSSYDYRLLDQKFLVEVNEIDNMEKFEIVSGVEAVSCKTPHTDESHAIHIRDCSGETLVFTADTGFAPEIAAFAKNVDLLIVESSYVRNKTTEKHLELAEAMYLIRKATPKRGMLAHLYPEWDEVDFEAEIRKFAPQCEVIEAVDGLRIEI